MIIKIYSYTIILYIRYIPVGVGCEISSVVLTCMVAVGVTSVTAIAIAILVLNTKCNYV